MKQPLSLALALLLCLSLFSGCTPKEDAPKVYEFSAGTYTVGQDIPPGLYDIVRVSGDGRCTVNYGSNNITSISSFFGDNAALDFKNCILDDPSKYENPTFEVTDNLKVKFTSKQPKLDPAPKQDEFIFTAGIYTIGKDIDPGMYDLYWVSGLGEFEFYHFSFEDMYYELFGDKTIDLAIQHYKNALLESLEESKNKFLINGSLKIKAVKRKDTQPSATGNTFTLSAGNYFINQDIPAGTYNIKWLFGDGWITIENPKDFKSYYEHFSDDYSAKQSLDNVVIVKDFSLNKGVFCIKKNVKLQFTKIK